MLEREPQPRTRTTLPSRLPPASAPRQPSLHSHRAIPQPPRPRSLSNRRPTSIVLDRRLRAFPSSPPRTYPLLRPLTLTLSPSPSPLPHRVGQPPRRHASPTCPRALLPLRSPSATPVWRNYSTSRPRRPAAPLARTPLPLACIPTARLPKAQTSRPSSSALRKMPLQPPSDAVGQRAVAAQRPAKSANGRASLPPNSPSSRASSPPTGARPLLEERRSVISSA